MCEVEDQFGSIAEIGHCRCGGEENKKTASCKTRHIPELRVERGRFYSIQFCQDHSFIDSRLSPANFSSFPPIKVLDLTGCGVRSIAPLTFERLQSLQELNLGRNNLSDVPPNAFSKVSIDRLNLAGNPGLRLTPETFVGADVRSLNLENCALGAAQVNHRSLQPLIERGGGAQLRTLYVGGNRLQTLDPALRPWVRSALRNVRRAGELQTHVLGLADNPLRCSCSLLWLADLARDYPEHFKQLSRVTCTLQTSVWPPSNVDAVPPSASALNRTVLLSELSQYAATLGCAPPSLSSLNMVLSESAAWEFKLRVEANPMPDYVLVARKSTLTLASEAGPNDEDAMIRTLLSLDPQQVVRATAASHVFDPVRNTFYADLSVRVAAGNTSDVGDYVLLARNHLGKFVFRLETKLARYFQLQQLVQQTTPAAVTANFTNLSGATASPLLCSPLALFC